MSATMARRRRTARQTSLVRVLLLAVIGSTTMGLLVGYVVGGSTTASQTAFSEPQSHYIDGFGMGMVYKVEYEAWKAVKAPPSDPRSLPGVRCASAYYPNDPPAMAGCTQALNKPADGYRMPPR